MTTNTLNGNPRHAYTRVCEVVPAALPTGASCAADNPKSEEPRGPWHCGRLFLVILIVTSIICPAGLFAGRDSAGFRYRDIVVEPGAKKALVVGIRAYAHVPPLNHPDSDAKDVAQLLTTLGFQVTRALDPSQLAFEEILSAFSATIRRGDVVLLYYAGHATAVEGENYLIPKDFNARLTTQVKAHAVALSDILRSLREREPQLLLIVTDACRSPIFQARGATDGLVPVTATGTLIAFGADVNERAFEDAKLGHGIFTYFLLEALKVPGLTLQDIFRRVRYETRAATDSLQNPFVYDGTDGDFVFRPAPAGASDSIPRASGGRLAEDPSDEMLSLRALAGDPTAMLKIANRLCDGKPVGGDTQKAGDFLAKAAATNTAAALTAYGVRLSEGSCIPRDDVAAVRFLSRGAIAGESEAMFYLALHYRQGRGVPVDNDTAMRWIARAAQLGWPAAKTALGKAEMQVAVTVHDRARAYERLIEAAQLEDRDAMASLGDAFRTGDGIRKDEAKAVEWTQKAAELGDIHSMEMMIDHALHGNGMAAKPESAVLWARRAADRGSTNATLRYADFLARGVGTNPDTVLAEQRLKQLAEIGSADAMLALAHFYMSRAAGDGRLPQAKEWLEKAGNAGNVKAQLELGATYAARSALRLDKLAAARWYKAAADQADPEGLFQLGQLRLTGPGELRDRADAYRLIGLAAKLGHVGARSWIEQRTPTSRSSVSPAGKR